MFSSTKYLFWQYKCTKCKRKMRCDQLWMGWAGEKGGCCLQANNFKQINKYFYD